MKREENEKKRKKNVITKAKRVRNMVMMLLLCVLMMSAATYAWFTLSNTAKIANLTMTVGEASGLQIAKDLGSAAGTYGNVLSFDDDSEGVTYKISGNLLPATTTDGINFKKPVYDEDGKVSGIIDTVDANDKITNATSITEGYYYETKFYLKTLGKDPIQVALKKGVSLPSTGIASEPNDASGTYVIAKNGKTKEKGYYGSQAIRISFYDGTNTLIYEPNSDVSGSEGKRAELVGGLTITPVASTSKQDKNGDWVGTQSVKLNVSPSGTQITMRVWIEGEDIDCANEISLNDIIAQIVFEEVTATPTP